MQKFLKRLFKFLAYTAAGFVILLAVAVGLFRLFLPKLPEYQEELKAWASQAIGMQVEFSGMDARWGLSGPELNFYDAELIRETNNTRVLAAEEVSVGVAALRLLRDRTLVVDRILIRDTSVEVRERADGRWWIQGTTLEQLMSMNEGGAPQTGDIEIIGEDIELQLLRIGDQRPTFIEITRLTVTQDDQRIAIDGNVRLPDTLGRQLSVSATQVFDTEATVPRWDVSVAARDLQLPGWTGMVDDLITPLTSGTANVDMSLRIAPGRVEQAAADFVFANVLAPGDEQNSADGAGRLEFRYDSEGWLVALEEFMLQSQHGSWPESSLRLEVGTDDDGTIEMFDLRAGYLNLQDVEVAMPWISDRVREVIHTYAPAGIVRNLNATATDFDAEVPDFAIAADVEDLGFDAVDKRPGVRNLSGRVRADRSGGLADIDSVNVQFSLPELLSVPVTLDDVYGTLIWRQGDDGITVLSDSVVLRNADMSTNSNVELTLKPGQSPFIDLSATFSVTDIAAVKRLIPDRIVKPKLYDWFQMALVSGRIQNGRARLNGPLSAFPFDNGEGRFLIEANVRDTRFQYLRDWPAAELLDVDAVLDGLHLYTERNQSVTLGNSIVNAKVDIPDLREPVLTIDGMATGTLESIRQYARNSPLAQFFAGQLDVVTVDGDGTLKLDLEVPIKRAREFEVSARVQSEGGSVLLPGLRQPITDLTGSVTINRDSVGSDGLAGMFVGQAVEFELQPAPEGLEGYNMVLNAMGSISSAGLIEGVGLPTSSFFDGTTEYTVSVLFPKANDAGALLTIEAASDLVGLAVNLPEPFTKAADEPLAFAGQMVVGRDAARIDTSGGVDDDVRWQLGFVRDSNNAWDLDRGVVLLGDATPPEAELSGLHIRGRASEVVFGDWLALGDGGGQDLEVLDWLRSIDLDVSDLRLFGQHLVDHSVRLDRSARDWLVQIEGEDVSGAVFVPYDLSGNRPVVFDMERLVLPGDAAVEDEAVDTTDPRTLPAMSLRAKEFALGDRYFGALEAEVLRTENGLETANIVTTDETFRIEANGAWLADDSDPFGSTTAVSATLTSTDMKATFDRLGYSPGLVGEEMSAVLDLNWSGGPGGDFLPSLDGEVQLLVGVGQLDEVEPGAGRVLGLMSIVALPRRLSLDFSDVFDKGFGFNKIEGTFRLEDGDTFTCNLSLEAPAADIAIVGRASLVDQDYEQTALIGANVGNVLPVAAAAAAGPQAAVAVLIFSQVFKKPLQGMGQVYYSIDGPWDDPIIEQADAERFAASSGLANCMTEQTAAGGQNGE